MEISLPLLMTVTVAVILFNCIGLFGNINVIVATLRNRELRTKAGSLMAILCSFQSMCLISELINIDAYWK
ncbi:hypothetical protein Y032_0520g2856 [Ancylostoma ceylanicum]|nr:hypothetical protein Y032_0520g2856 [Ancylostoma ceylanicum]